MSRVDLDGNPIKAMTICMIGAGGFIGSHLCEKLMAETPHTVLALDVYNDKIRHLLDDGGPFSGRIQFHRLNIKHDSRLEGLIKMSDLVRSLSLSLYIDLHLYSDPFIIVLNGDRSTDQSIDLTNKQCHCTADHQFGGYLHPGGL